MVSLISIGLRKYNGIALVAGQAFEVRDQDARVLILMGKAKPVDDTSDAQFVGDVADSEPPVVKRKRGRPRKTPVVA